MILNILKNRNIFGKIPLALFLGNLLALFFLRDALSIPTDTESAYSPLAISFMQGKGYFLNGEFYTHQPPFFSFFLSVVYKISNYAGTANEIYPFIVVFLQSCSCLFFSALGKRLLKIQSNRIPWLVATYPPFMVLTATHYAWNAMPLFLFLFSVSLLLFEIGKDNKNFGIIFLSGLIHGLAALTWAGIAYLWIVIFLWHVIFSKKIKSVICAGLFCAAFLVPTLGWSSYIYQKTGHKIFVASAAFFSLRDGLTHENYSVLRTFDFPQEALQRLKAGQLETMHDVLNLSISEWKMRPLKTAQFFVYKVLRPWYASDAEAYDRFLIFIQIPYLAFGAAGIFFLWRMEREKTLFLLFFILYFWAISACMLSILRYMVPAMCLMMIFVGAALDKAFPLKGRRI